MSIQIFIDCRGVGIEFSYSPADEPLFLLVDNRRLRVVSLQATQEREDFPPPSKTVYVRLSSQLF